MSKYRFATIGTSSITSLFVESAALYPEVEWGAAYSRTIESATAFTKGQKDIAVYDSLDALAADSSIEIVYIASPTSCHAAQAIQMLQAGKHVLCEKPAASNLREWQAMQAAAKQAGKVLLEATRPLFSPGYATIRENLHKLGAIRKVQFSYCQYSSRYDNYKNGKIENAFRPEFSNGALMDIGVYCVESMVGLFGAPKSVQAVSYILENSIDGMGNVNVAYDGMLGTLSYSKISAATSCGEIQGERGTLYYDNVGSPAHVRIVYRDEQEEVLFDEPQQYDMVYELQTFIKGIKGQDEIEKYWSITTDALTLMDQVREQCGIHFPADEK